MQTKKAKLVQIPRMTPEYYYERFKAAGLNLRQMRLLTDISEQRQRRIIAGNESSLIFDQEDQVYYVPRCLVLALLLVENTFLLEPTED